MQRSLVRILAFAAAAFAGQIEQQALAGRNDNSVTFAYEQTVENLDPYFNNVRGGFIIGQQIWDTLIFRDPETNEYKGQLASGWRWIDDRTLEVDLRPGIRFHNGAEFTADDVAYTLKFVSDPINKVVIQQSVSWIEDVEKLGLHKVRIRAKGAFPAAVEHLAGPLVIHPHEYYARVGPQGVNTNPVGSGPFRVTEHILGKEVRLERNPDYFRESPKLQPKLDRVQIRFIPDRQTQLAELLSGGIDLIMNVTADQAKDLRSRSHLQVLFSETMRIAFLQLNPSAGPLRDIRVRKAIAHAINRDVIARSLVGEGSRVLHAVCFPTQFGCNDEDVPRYRYDAERSRTLLAEAGLASGIDIDFYAFRERTQAEAIAGYLRAVGVRTDLRFLQFAAVRNALRAGKVSMAYQTWGSFSINDVSASTPVFFEFTPDDVARDEEIRALLQQGNSSTEPRVRREAYARALALIQERAYALPLYSLPIYYAAAKNLRLRVFPDEMLRFWEIEWE
jgi:peptide/nickel transport system substrate-binding protein